MKNGFSREDWNFCESVKMKNLIGFVLEYNKNIAF